MKSISRKSRALVAWLLAGLAAVAIPTVRADPTKANNNTALQSGGSWVSGWKQALEE